MRLACAMMCGVCLDIGVLQDIVHEASEITLAAMVNPPSSDLELREFRK